MYTLQYDTESIVVVSLISNLPDSILLMTLVMLIGAPRKLCVGGESYIHLFSSVRDGLSRFNAQCF